MGPEASSHIVAISDLHVQVLDTCRQREEELEKAMEELQGFHRDLADVLRWLKDVESRQEVSPRDMQLSNGDGLSGPREMCKVVGY